MTFALFLLFLLIAYYFYNKLSGRITDLEHQISELKNTAPTDIPDQKPLEILKEQNVDLSDEVPLEANLRKKLISETSQIQKEDWFSQLLAFIQDNILSILGIITLILGMGYFVKYAIDRDWIGETARVAIGILAGVGIASIGFFLRKNYKIFSYILTGGALVMLYFSITLGFRQYHLFSQTVTFLILTLITVLAIAIAYLYNSQSLILIAVIGGFCAPLMASSGAGNFTFLLGYIMLLNFGMLVIIFLKNWKSLGWVCFIISMIYFFSWILYKPQIISTVYLYLFYAVIYAFALLNYFRGRKLQKFDIVMLVLVNIFTVGQIISTFKLLDYEPIILIPISFAIVNALLSIREIRSGSHLLFSVFSGLVISLVTFAVAVYLNNFIITSFWAIESCLLFYLWLKTGHDVFKKFFGFVFVLLVMAQVVTWYQYYDDENLSIIFNKVFLTSLLTGLSVLFNLWLLNRRKNVTDNTALQSTLMITSIILFYGLFLFEIGYHIKHFSYSRIFIILLLYSVYYCFVISILQQLTKAKADARSLINYLIFAFVALLTGFATSEDAIDMLRNSMVFYGFYLLYLIPLVFTLRKILIAANQKKQPYPVWISLITLSLVLCLEINHLYIIFSKATALFEDLTQQFIVFWLPIIWAIIGVSIIYIGIRKSLSVFTKFGFILIGLMVIKLYFYDIWEMDNISRIIAFILLGVILLTSSFTFQKLKKMLINVIDKDQPDDDN